MRNLCERLVAEGIITDSGKLSKKSKGLLQKLPAVASQVQHATQFLPTGTPLRIRLFCIINNISKQPVCRVCSAPTKFRGDGVNVGFNHTCSVECKRLDRHSKQKRIKTNTTKYGAKAPAQNEQVKQKTVDTNLTRYGRVHKNQKHWESDTVYLVNDKDWLQKEHHDNKRTLLDISSELGIDNTTLRRHFDRLQLDTRTYFQSSGERELIRELSDLPLILNNRKLIQPYELDIYIPTHKLAIEYCGLYWHSEQCGKLKYYHHKKHQMCREQNIQLLTIFEDEWKNHKQIVLDTIRAKCGLLAKRVYARSTQIVVVSQDDRNEFFNKYHIQGYGRGSVNLGLVENNKLVACASFIKHRNNTWELTRFASRIRVVGGFSKLLAHFIKQHHPSEIYTFADKRWSDGTLYHSTGFTIVKELPPDYYYSPDGKQRIHKFNYRRKQLPKLLANFDPTLSERRNCNNHNILRIWDCGKYKFLLDVRTS